ncbi:MAG: hypothetical protein AB1576_04720 [Bacillota bacterium]
MALKKDQQISEFSPCGIIHSLSRTPRGEIVLYEPTEVEVVLGRCSSLQDEVVPGTLERGVPVSRRRGGGCSVVVGPGVLVLGYTRKGAPPAWPLDWARHMTRLLLSGLEGLGVTGLALRDGDIALGDRKILGSCLYLSQREALYGASLLVSPDLGLVSELLLHPPREPKYRRGRTHGEFITSLHQEGFGLATARIARGLEPLLRRELEQDSF